MTNREDLRGSKCSTLTDEQRAHIEQTDGPSEKGLTLCGQHRRWDSDDYLPRSTGTLFKTTHGPGDREGVEMRLDWCDHGHTTHYFVNDYHVGKNPTFPTVEDSARAHLESIWSAGWAIAWCYITARRENTP